MSTEYIAYKKFTDTDAAEQVIHILEENDIDCHLEDQQHAYVKVVGYNAIDFGITVNLKETDFARADLVLEQYYANQIHDVDADYYLFEFTEKELLEIIENPSDWGQFDFQLAKEILKNKGINFSNQYHQDKKLEKVESLSKIKKVPVYTLIAGYICAFLLPPIGMVIGISIVYNRNILPTGQKFYVHSQNDRNHGYMILLVSLLWSLLIIARVILQHR